MTAFRIKLIKDFNEVSLPSVARSVAPPTTPGISLWLLYFLSCWATPLLTLLTLLLLLSFIIFFLLLLDNR